MEKHPTVKKIIPIIQELLASLEKIFIFTGRLGTNLHS